MSEPSLVTEENIQQVAGTQIYIAVLIYIAVIATKGPAGSTSGWRVRTAGSLPTLEGGAGVDIAASAGL
jgi:hypothetical protein